mmetsp:Transcript_19539/g.61958  ORF Transcript_19539/g.61958 Transcript_19539/m.61958 type:complete len:353 (+) Transcript_19539:528-1586(+)
MAAGRRSPPRAPPARAPRQLATLGPPPCRLDPRPLPCQPPARPPQLARPALRRQTARQLQAVRSKEAPRWAGPCSLAKRCQKGTPMSAARPWLTAKQLPAASPEAPGPAGLLAAARYRREKPRPATGKGAAPPRPGCAPPWPRRGRPGRPRPPAAGGSAPSRPRRRPRASARHRPTARRRLQRPRPERCCPKQHRWGSWAHRPVLPTPGRATLAKQPWEPPRAKGPGWGPALCPAGLGDERPGPAAARSPPPARTSAPAQLRPRSEAAPAAVQRPARERGCRPRPARRRRCGERRFLPDPAWQPAPVRQPPCLLLWVPLRRSSLSEGRRRHWLWRRAGSRRLSCHRHCPAQT